MASNNNVPAPLHREDSDANPRDYTKNYMAVSFYIVAHQDDWQLFMTPNSHHALRAPATKVVFVYTTAGDAGKDIKYWSARENGAMRSVQFGLDTPLSRPTQVIGGQRTFLGHTICCLEYKRSVSYFLRLPDGRMTGRGSPVYASESLSKLRNGHIPSITAVDRSATYAGWDDLCKTLGAIIKAESEGAMAVWLHASDFMPSARFGDNADHTATGLAVTHTIDLLGGQYPLTLFRDYDIALLPPNLSAVEVLWKTSLCVAYDVTVQAEVDHCTHCESPFYMHWCMRQYSRQLHPNNRVVNFLGSLRGNLYHAFANARRALGAPSEGMARH